MLSASPEVSTQQSGQSCASVFSLPTLWSPGPAATPLLVLGSALPAVTVALWVDYRGDGFCLPF